MGANVADDITAKYKRIKELEALLARETLRLDFVIQQIGLVSLNGVPILTRADIDIAIENELVRG